MSGSGISGFGITTDELRKSIGTAAAPRLFDVRYESEFSAAERMLPAARRRRPDAAPAEFAAGAVTADHIVVYCGRGGSCAQSVAAQLRAAGLAARYLIGGFEGWLATGAPTTLKNALPGRERGRPSVWVTRVRPKIDRIACPWLVSRFIDPDAEFLFVEPSQVEAVAAKIGGIPYDIEGVPFGHDGPLCTFDTLIRVFGIADQALDGVATIVRGADTARLDLAPEAAGLLAVSLGNSAIAGADDRHALALGFPVYDALYAWQHHAASETHNWPRPS